VREVNWRNPHEPFGDAFSAYRPPSGGHHLAESVVLYMDVLGFSSFSTGPNAQEHLDELLKALAAAREEAMTDFSAGLHATTWFTDNLAVAFPVERVGDPAIAVSLAELMAARLQVGLAIRGYYWSGGIEIGAAYLERDFVFGAAIVDAVELEKVERKQSGGSLPRVLLGSGAAAINSVGVEGFVAALSRGLGVDLDTGRLADLELRRSDGQLTFVSYLDWMLLENRALGGSPETARNLMVLHRDGIVTALQDPGLEERVRAKYRWLADYHDAICDLHFAGEPDLCVISPGQTGG
jgi:hypothetical protein